MRVIYTTLFLTLLLLISQDIRSQATITIPDFESYPCTNIDVPVVAAGFPENNVGSITLYIDTDPSVLTYNGYTLGTLPITSIISYNPSTGLITVVVSLYTPISIDGVMLTFDFTYEGGSCAIDITDNSEIAEGTLPYDPIPFTAFDGFAGPMPRTNYYVDAAADPGGDGLSWGTAFQTITAATNAALDRGDHVTIKPGTYNEAIVIKSNGLELVPVTTGISVTGSNTVVFPAGPDLDCIDAASYPDEMFLYMYRSLRGNNGIFEIQSIDPATRTVTVRAGGLINETGTAGDTTKLQASIAHAIVYRKDTNNANPVVVNASSVLGPKAACYVGTPIGSGDDATPANYNIIDGINLTGITAGATGRYGLRIQGSKHNAFIRGKIYECDSVGILISGNDAHPAKRNIIANCTIFNIKQKGLKLGKEGVTAANNRVHHNLFLHSEVYSTGSGPNKGFYSMAETHPNTSHNIIEKNTFRNFSFQAGGMGAVKIGNNSPSNLVIGNYFKDISDALSSTNAYIYVRSGSVSTKVFNNILLKTSAVDDDIYAFRLNGQGHTGSGVYYNTVYNVDRGVLFEDPGAAPSFQLKNNILHQINDYYFVHSGTVGRFTVSNNSYGSDPTQSGGFDYWPDATSVTGDPLFLDPAFFDSPYGFTVQTGSSCLSHGTPISTLTHDYSLDARDGTNPTIGAFENVITGLSWTGAVTENWHDYRNWSPEIVPGSNLDVTVPVTNNDPQVINNDAECKTIGIQSGARVIVNSPNTLTIIN